MSAVAQKNDDDIILQAQIAANTLTAGHLSCDLRLEQYF
jgi:hypothetical protein